MERPASVDMPEKLLLKLENAVLCSSPQPCSKQNNFVQKLKYLWEGLHVLGLVRWIYAFLLPCVHMEGAWVCIALAVFLHSSLVSRKREEENTLGMYT